MQPTDARAVDSLMRREVIAPTTGAVAMWVATENLVDISAASTSAGTYGVFAVDPGAIPSGVALSPGIASNINTELMFGRFGAVRTAYNTTTHLDLRIDFTGLPAHTTVAIDFRVGIPPRRRCPHGPWTGPAALDGDHLCVFVGTPPFSAPAQSYALLGEQQGTNFDLTTGGVAHTGATVSVGFQGRVTPSSSPDRGRYGVRNIVLRVC